MDIREVERLVWLLGEPAQKFSIHQRDVEFPWKYAANDPVELALKRCFDDVKNAEAKEAFQAMVIARRQKLQSLHQMLQPRVAKSARLANRPPRCSPTPTCSTVRSGTKHMLGARWSGASLSWPASGAWTCKP